MHLVLKIFGFVDPIVVVREVGLRPFAIPKELMADRDLAVHGPTVYVPIVDRAVNDDAFPGFSSLGARIDGRMIEVFVVQDPVACTVEFCKLK